jgi:Ca2+/Na+ antiporter
MKNKISLYDKILILIGIIFTISIIFFIFRGVIDLLVIGFLFSLFVIVTYVIFRIDKEIKKSDEYKKPEKELTKLGWLLLSLVIILSFVIPILFGVYGIEPNAVNLLIMMGILCIPSILIRKYGIHSTK